MFGCHAPHAPWCMPIHGITHGGYLFVITQGLWAKTLGFGDFYYELGVQIVEVRLATPCTKP